MSYAHCGSSEYHSSEIVVDVLFLLLDNTGLLSVLAAFSETFHMRPLNLHKPNHIIQVQLRLNKTRTQGNPFLYSDVIHYRVNQAVRNKHTNTKSSK